MRPFRLPVPALLALGLCATFVACSENDDPLGPGGLGGAPNGTMTATLDGAPWSAVTITVTRGGGFLSVAGSNADPLAIGFTIQEAGPGTYPIGPGQVTSANVTILSSVWTAATGQIVFTTIEADRVAGTFQFTAPLSVGSGAAERVVTAGSFDATY
jgi:hypothetical protein